MPRFSVVLHTTPAPEHCHIDWFFEQSTHLFSLKISLRDWPTEGLARTWPHQVLALRQFDHRCIYLSYRGPISRNRGYVTPLIQGTTPSIVQVDNSCNRQIIRLKNFGILSLENVDQTNYRVHFTAESAKKKSLPSIKD